MDPLQDLLNNLPVRKERKLKVKITAVSRYDHKKLYYDARKVMFQREYPQAWMQGEYFDGKVPDTSSTNGHQRYMEDVINFNGHHCERVNVMGVPVEQPDGTIKWRRSGSTIGSPDLHAIVKNVTWKIEAKNKDTMRKGQIKYEAKMKRIGILHSVIRVGELDLFWDEYYKIIAS